MREKCYTITKPILNFIHRSESVHLKKLDFFLKYKEVIEPIICSTASKKLLN